MLELEASDTIVAEMVVETVVATVFTGGPMVSMALIEIAMFDGC